MKRSLVMSSALALTLVLTSAARAEEKANVDPHAHAHGDANMHGGAHAKAEAKADAKADTKADGKVDAKAALERLKQLVGDWQAAPPSPWTMNYRLTGGGSAVLETLFPGTEMEMISIYYLDGDELVMNHYCASGNQPRMKLDRAASRFDKLQFVFTGGTNIQDDVPHAHQGWISVKDADHFDAEWTRFVKGKAMPGGVIPLFMTRKK